MRKAREYRVPGIATLPPWSESLKGSDGGVKACEQLRVYSSLSGGDPAKRDKNALVRLTAQVTARSTARLIEGAHRAPAGRPSARRSEELGRGETGRKVPQPPAATFEASYSEPLVWTKANLES